MDEPTTKGSLPDVSGPEAGRRRLLKALTVSAGAAAAAAVLPKDWVKPVVDAVDVPLHAQGTATLTISNLVLTPPGGVTVSGPTAVAVGNWTGRFSYLDLLAQLTPDNTQLSAELVNALPPTCTQLLYNWDLLRLFASVNGTPTNGTITFPFNVSSPELCGRTPLILLQIRTGSAVRLSNQITMGMPSS